MYKHTLSVYGEYLAQGQSLPQNASADGAGAVLDLRGCLGAVEILAEVNEAAAIASAKNLTVKLQHRDAGGEWSDLGTIYSVTGAQTLAAGTVLGRFIPPSDVKAELKAVISTTDPAATGKLDVTPAYLAR
jgi:hypothetical protein